MQSLMHLCKNWGEDNCYPDVSVHDHPMWLEEPDLVKLNNICQLCDKRFFEISKRKCPVCEGKDLVEIKRSIIKDVTNRKIFENFELKCNQCKTPLVLKKLIPKIKSFESHQKSEDLPIKINMKRGA